VFAVGDSQRCSFERKQRTEYSGQQKDAAGREEQARGAGELAALARIASGDMTDTLERAMTTVKEGLGMDMVFVSRFTEDQMMFRALEGDAESFGWNKGYGIPLEGTFCKRVVDGQVPIMIQDAKNDERLNDLDVTWDADIGSYVGLPLRFSNGQVYGTLCCLSHSSDPAL
jgi:GAF domain-containing protein